MDNRNIISKYDLFVSLIVTVIGTGSFSYSRELSERVGSEGWIVILFTGVIVAILLYLVHKAIQLNNYDRLLDILHNNFGNIFGNFIAVLIAISGIFVVALQMRIFIEVTKMYLLEKTPTEFMIFTMILTGTFFIRGEFESIIRFNEIAFWLTFIPILLTIPFILKGGDFTNILPVFTYEPIEYLKASKTSFFSFLGFGIIYMLFPYVKEKNKISKTVSRSLGFIVGFYLIITATSLVVFSKKYNSQLLWPAISMFFTVDIPGAFVERWEGIAMVFWILFYFTTYINIYYFDAEIIRDVFHLEDTKISLMLIIPFIYAMALYPGNVAEVYDIQSKIIPYIDTTIIGILPIVLLIIAFFKTRRVKNEV
ncbi:GerAB/ArcD/ProY family transporter [Clostridium ganghwense]|uniref:Endospore germination permease n=1 Tax=Clostridium ganghwense TaxID=312089 RepID=A0ABT4CN38_9CLOT|nr:endospore germination permease [Clostridium ganghwense]MCY6369853.1 endospore germination permease [Clostridium ganghwense]